MRKLIKATAILLAASILLTGCSDIDKDALVNAAEKADIERAKEQAQHIADERQKNLEKEFEVYTNAPITEVEDQPYTLNKVTGEYSGDWKGNRPEGEGTLWLSDDEYYYSENWSNGEINGYAEIKRYDSDGKLRQYKGVCAYSEPYGNGTLEIGSEGDELRMVIDGDFTKPSELLYYTLDENGGCVDVGGFITGEFESYMENSGVTGREWLIDRQPTGGATYKSRSGHYIGQVNENGLPDGYGYYAEDYELNQGIIVQLTSCTYYAIGSWKNGKLEGYFTDVLIGKGTLTETETGFFGGKKETKYSIINSTKREGNVKNDKLVGTNRVSTTIASEPPRPLFDGVFITRMDYDTNVKMVEQIDVDGTHTYEWKHMISATAADEGEFIKYDQDGNMTIHKTLSNGTWTELKNLEREAREAQEARQRIINKGAAIALVGVTFAAGCYLNYSAMKNFDNSSAGKWLADYKASLERGAKQREEDRAKYYENKEKADHEWAIGNYETAGKLYKEADKYSGALSWLER